MFKRKGGGVKGLLNNVQKNCTFLKGWLPLFRLHLKGGSKLFRKKLLKDNKSVPLRSWFKFNFFSNTSVSHQSDSPANTSITAE